MAEKVETPEKAANGRTLARWDPFERLDALQDEIGRIWGQGWPFATWQAVRPLREMARTAGAWTPRLDVYEKDGFLYVKAELPGVKKDEIEVTLDQGDLVIKGQRTAETEVKEEHYYRMERSYGTFLRRLPLPFEAKPEQVEATFADGVLEVKVPKPAAEAPQSKAIPIA